MHDPRFRNFAEFYPYYLAQHRHPLCRALHFIGTTAVLFCALLTLVSGDIHLLYWLPLLGYGPAWIGHFFFEHNRPATFRHPLYSLLGDFHMYVDILRGLFQPS